LRIDISNERLRRTEWEGQQGIILFIYQYNKTGSISCHFLQKKYDSLETDCDLFLGHAADFPGTLRLQRIPVNCIVQFFGNRRSKSRNEAMRKMGLIFFSLIADREYYYSRNKEKFGTREYIYSRKYLRIRVSEEIFSKN
jgi:hypothetical protein